MAIIEDAVRTLRSLADPDCDGEPLQLEDVERLQATAQSSDSGRLWDEFLDGAVSPSALGRSLTSVMQSENQRQAFLAAITYGTLLGTPNCPVFRIFDAASCDAYVRVIGNTYLREGATGDGGGPDTLMHDAEISQQIKQDLLPASLGGFAGLLASYGLQEQPDLLRSVAELLSEVARCALVPAAAVEACYDALLAMFDPKHGSIADTAAIVLRLLTPALLGVSKASSSRTTSTAPKKEAISASQRAITFVVELLRSSAAAKDAVAALARHIVIKAPDKTEYRNLAADAAVGFVSKLPMQMQHEFAAFTAKLSGTAKVSQRLMAVGLAIRLLNAVADPYSAATVLQRSVGPDTPSPLLGSLGSTAPNTGSTGGSRTPNLPLQSAASGPDSTGGSAQRQQNPAPIGTVCLAVLVQRCSDKSAAVRAKAIGNLAAVVGSSLSRADTTQIVQALAQAHSVQLQQQTGCDTPTSIMLVSPAATDEPGATPMVDTTDQHGRPMTLARIGNLSSPWTGQTAVSCHSSRLGFIAATNAAMLNMRDMDIESLVRIARKRAHDEKAGVRKAGVTLLEELLRLRAQLPPPLCQLPKQEDISTLENATADPLVSVRRAALNAISNLAQDLPTENVIAQLWVSAALPLVQDVESSVQEATVDQVHEKLLARAAAAGKSNKGGEPSAAAEDAVRLLRPFLGCLPGANASSLAGVRRACAALKARSRLNGKAAAAGLQRIISQSGDGPDARLEVSGAWQLLADVAAQDPAATSWTFLQEQWGMLQRKAQCGGSSSQDASCMLLQIIAAAAAKFPADEAARLSNDLLQAIKDFELSPTAVSAHLTAVANLQPDKKAEWCRQILAEAERHLAKYVERGGQDSAPDAECRMVSTAVFTAGEVALQQAVKMPGNLVVLIQALTAEHLLPPAADANGFDQSVTGAPVPTPIQAHAWTALSKLCLMDERLAKACVPHFVRHLRSADAAAVRNNIVIGLADLCITHTGLVDTHVPRLAACLGDRHELVRRQTLALIAHLLQKDFVKWRGPLLHRFLLALVDDSSAVRSLAEFLLHDTLETKAPLLAYNHFVESMYALNNCLEGSAAGALASREDDTAGSVAGSSATAVTKRDAIYKALLQQMNPEHKFATAARISSEVLGGAADGSLPLTGPSVQVLADGLRVLACPHIRGVAFPQQMRLIDAINHAPGQTKGFGAAVTPRVTYNLSRQSTSQVAASKAGAAAGDDETEGGAAAAAGAARGKVVSSMMRKHLVGNIVPVAIQLKRVLEEARHPLLGDLMAALAVLLADHKHEMEDILAADQQLAKELLYDIRQAAAARKAAAAEAQLVRCVASVQLQDGSASGGRGPLRERDLRQQALLRSAFRPSPGRRVSGTLPDTPTAAEVLASAGKGRRCSSDSGRSTPARRLQSPLAQFDECNGSGSSSLGHPPATAMKTPAPPTALKTPTPGSGGAAQTPGSAGMSVPRLRPSSHARPSAPPPSLTAEDTEPIHVIVKGPTPPTPWRLAAAEMTSAYGAENVPVNDSDAGPQAEAPLLQAKTDTAAAKKPDRRNGRQALAKQRSSVDAKPAVRSSKRKRNTVK